MAVNRTQASGTVAAAGGLTLGPTTQLQQAIFTAAGSGSFTATANLIPLQAQVTFAGTGLWCTPLLLLDNVTSASTSAAYSTRRLRSAYTGSLLRVRRSSDNTESDIGYTGANVLDTSALTTFVGANNGFITKWYDQSGNGLDVVQAVTANQPKIVAAGVVNTLNGNAAVNFIRASSTFLSIASAGTNFYGTTAFTFLSGFNLNTNSDVAASAEQGDYIWADQGDNFIPLKFNLVATLNQSSAYFFGSTDNNATWGSSLSLSTGYVGIGQFTGAVLSTDLSGGTPVTTNTAQTITLFGTNQYVGGGAPSVLHYHDGSVTDIIWFKTALALSDLNILGFGKDLIIDGGGSMSAYDGATWTHIPVTWQAAVTFAGTGSLFAAAPATSTNWAGSATFAPVGNYQVVANLVPNQAQVTFAGAGNFSATANLIPNQAQATFAGAGNFSATASLSPSQAQVSFLGAGSLSASVIARLGPTVTFGGAGSLSVTANLIPNQAQVTFAGAGGFSATANLIPNQAQVTFAGAGGFSAVANLIPNQAAVTFAGAGNFSATANLSPSQAAVTFAGAGSFSAAVTARLGPTVTFAGVGSFSASVTARLGPAVTFAGAGSFLTLANLIPNQATVTYAGAGAFSAAVTLNEAASVTFSGASTFLANTISKQQAQVTFAGAGSLFADTISKQQAQVTFAGAGSLFAFAAGITAWAGSVRFDGAGSIFADTISAQQAIARFATTGSFALTTFSALTAAASFAGSGSLLTDASNTKQGFVRFAGAGSFTATALSSAAAQFASVVFAGIGSFFAAPFARLFAVGELSLFGSRAPSAAFTACDIVTSQTRYLYISYEKQITGTPYLVFYTPNRYLHVAKSPQVEIGTEDALTCRGVFIAGTYLRCKLDVSFLLSSAGVWTVANSYDGPGQRFYVSAED